MKLSTFLKHRYHQWTTSARQRAAQGLYAVLQDAHTCTVPKGNLYVEHDIGNKLIRYPDGKRRPIHTTKVRDTGGVTFYAFDLNTPLS